MTKQPPVTLRVPAELRAAVEAFADRKKIAKNAAYVQLIQDGLSAAGSHRPRPPQRAVEAANRAIEQAIANPPGRPAQTGVQLGPTPVKPGSRLKGAKK